MASEAMISAEEDGGYFHSPLYSNNSEENEEEKYSVWFRHTGQPEPPRDEIPEMKVYYYPKQMNLSDIRKEIGEHHNITHMWIEKNIPKWLHRVAPHLRVLKLHDIPALDQQMARLIMCEKLENLSIGDNIFSTGELPVTLYDLKTLKVLNISNCGLKVLDGRLTELSLLTRIHLSQNEFSGGTVPDVVHRLKNLKDLRLWKCGLEDLDPRLAELTGIKKLVIGGNYFVEGKLPPVVYQLKNLRELFLAGSGLVEIDEGIANLQQLSMLSLAGNEFRKLPTRLSSLRNLQHLRLNHLTHITSLKKDLFVLPSLEQVDCDGCYSLQTPPYEVCKQGIKDIRTYFDNLEEGVVNKLPIITGAVIGNTMAGKTSLILSLQKNRRELTYRNAQDAIKDETTKAFKVNEVTVGDEKISLFDFGGDMIYHITHQLAIRENYIPIVVVSMQQYADIAKRSGPKEAAWQLCMCFLSQLYLACPDLGPPILVLTHKDCFTDSEFDCNKSELLVNMEELRSDIIKEEGKYTNTNGWRQITHLNNISKSIFQVDDICILSKDLGDTDSISKLKSDLQHRGVRQTIPQFWELVAQYIDGKSQVSYILFSELSSEFPGKNIVVVLRFMHNSGRILWFENSDELGIFIFHRLSVITDMITTLFNHRIKDLWQQRIQAFHPFRYGCERVMRGEYISLVETYRKTGILDEAIMCHLLAEQPLPVDIAILVLKSFSVVCGPIKRTSGRDYFILPYFSDRTIKLFSCSPCLIPLQASIHFVGLSPPTYVYNISTVLFLRSFIDPSSQIRIASNGATVGHGKYVSHIVHDYKSSRISIQTECPIDDLDRGWKYLFEMLEYILLNLANTWAAAHPIAEFSCAHCIYLGDETPDVIANPEWYTLPTGQNGTLKQRLRHFEGIDLVRCRNNHPQKSVPRPLKFPCLAIKTAQRKWLEKFLVVNLERLRSRRQPALGEPEGCTSEEMGQYVGEIVEVMKACRPRLFLKPEQCTIPNREKQYRLSKTRGRALIISNKCGTTRPGSEHDYANLQRMFEDFGFVTVGDHKDYTATEIVSTIHTETQYLGAHTHRSVHEDLGMFVLVLTSHGGEGSIIGSDHRRVKLTDIYKLLSPKNFPAMQGKPKLVIIQACAGDLPFSPSANVDSPTETLPNPALLSADPVQGGHVTQIINDHVTSHHGQELTTPNMEDVFDDIDGLDGSTMSSDMADFFIMQSCFESFVSARNSGIGSPFIRALVTTFYRFAHRLDVAQLAEIIRESVSRHSIQRIVERQSKPLNSQQKSQCAAQMPRITSTLTDLRKLYLEPGFNMTDTADHPEEITRLTLPAAEYATSIKWCHDLVVKQRRGKQTKRAVYKQWEVSESSKQGKMLDPPNRPEMFEGVIGDLPDICTCI